LIRGFGHRETLPIGEVNGHSAAETELESYRAAIREITEVCQEAAKGNLEPRVLTVPAEGGLGGLRNALNHLLDLTDAFVRESRASLQASVEGRFYRQVIERGLLGTFRDAAKLINSANAELARRTHQIQKAKEARQELATVIQEVASGVAAAATEVHASAEQLMITAGQASRTMGELKNASSQIADTLKLISGIARETHLLALNAAIEAVRVGEQGRGFGVVAGEVKKLAAQAGDAASEIQDRVGRIQTAAGRTAEAVEVLGGSEEQGAAAQMTMASRELSKMAEQLKAEVDRFLSEMRET
jgi:methyl-accepting chemotaxis protein